MATSAGLLTCPPLFGSGVVLRLPLCGTFPAFRSASGQLPRGLCVDLQQRDCSGLSPDSLIRIAVAKISIYCHNRARVRRFFSLAPRQRCNRCMTFFRHRRRMHIHRRRMCVHRRRTDIRRTAAEDSDASVARRWRADGAFVLRAQHGGQGKIGRKLNNQE